MADNKGFFDVEELLSEKAKIECDKIEKKYGLDKIDKDIIASTNLDEEKESEEE